MKKKTRSGLVWLLAFSLLLSVAASSVALSSRIRYYTAMADVDSMIPLVPDYVTVDDLRPTACGFVPTRPTAGVRFAPINITYCAPPPETYFSVKDENGVVWSTSTPVEIFKSSYENGAHTVTVLSDNGDKVVAPGTENRYAFTLKNALSVPMDYTVAVRAYYGADDGGTDDLRIPVLCRLSRYDGVWLAGADDNWLDVPTFDGADDAAKMNGNSYVTYTLDWQWPFEGDDVDSDDAYDTLLGNLAADEDIKLTIEILTTAEADLDDDDPDDPTDPVDPVDPVDPDKPVDPDQPVDPDDPDDPDHPDDPADPDQPVDPDKPGIGEDLPPNTGDDSNLTLWLIVAGVSLVLLILLSFGDEKTTKAEAKKS